MSVNPVHIGSDSVSGGSQIAKKKSGKKSADGNDKKLKEMLRRSLRAKGSEFLKDENVTSIGVGLKNGDGPVCLQFTVGKKGESALESLDMQPLPTEIEINGVTIPTDVLERDHKPSYDLVAPEELDSRRTRQDPIRPAGSVSATSMAALELEPGGAGIEVLSANDLVF